MAFEHLVQGSTGDLKGVRCFGLVHGIGLQGRINNVLLVVTKKLCETLCHAPSVPLLKLRLSFANQPGDFLQHGLG